MDSSMLEPMLCYNNANSECFNSILYSVAKRLKSFLTWDLNSVMVITGVSDNQYGI